MPNKFSPKILSNIDLNSLSDEKLLDMRICDLGLKIEGSVIHDRVQKFYDELKEKGITFHPPCYLADEWFVPEGDTVVGIPFYLTHPRLQQLEEKMMGEVEGQSSSWFMKLLRHEAGHAIYYAYALNKKRKLKKIFKTSVKKKKKPVRLKPYSKNFVVHLDNWYAQTDPDEDFAETFAVWLTPDSDWRDRYQGWKTLAKLEYVDQLMKEISGKPPSMVSNKPFYSASKLTMRLKTYYRRKRKTFEEDYPEFYDSDLLKIFSKDSSSKFEPAKNFLRRNRKLIVKKVSLWTKEKKFTINNLMKKLIDRSEKLSLKVSKGEAEMGIEVCAYLTSMVSNYRLTGRLKRS